MAEDFFIVLIVKFLISYDYRKFLLQSPSCGISLTVSALPFIFSCSSMVTY